MLKAGNLVFETYPIAFFPDWRKVRQFDWRNLEMGFNVVATYDCRPPQTLPNLKKKLSITPHIMTSARTPLGQPNRAAFAARMRRMIGASGLKTEAAFLESIGKQFPDPSAQIDVPAAEILRRMDKNYRQIIGYWRRDRFILLTPRGRNPNGDYMILCLPDQIHWRIYTIGICGTERRKPDGTGLELAWRKDRYVFDAPGPYKKIKPLRFDYDFKTSNWPRKNKADVQEDQKNEFWKKLEKEDALQRKRSKETGKPTGRDAEWLDNYSLPDVLLDIERVKAEEKRLSDEYG